VASRLKTSRAGLYGDFVEQVDDSMGRILAALDESGAAQNTLLIVTSDNGAPWSKPDVETSGGHEANRPWRGQKADIQEAGHRVPFLVRFPGRARAGSASAETVCLTDIFHTAAKCAGASLSEQMAEDSFDFTPALSGAPARPVRQAIVHHSAQGLFSIRQGTWKLVLGRGSGGFTPPQKIEPKPGEPAGELYDLAADPHEDHNLYAERSDVVARLTALLERYRREGRSRTA
jgi:arylsulfatase A-like enzyme